MTLQEAIRARHSVRAYTDRKIPQEIRRELQEEIERCNAEGRLHIQAVWDAPEVFAGKVNGAANAICLISGKDADRDERLGYYGARIMLKAQMLGLNSLWAAMSFNKKEAVRHCDIAEGEALVNAIAIGYGATQGTARRSKPMEKLCACEGEMPGWFRAGMEAAMLAPTAINQQQFHIELAGGKVAFKAKFGPWSKVDLGIVKYFFEAGSGRKN